MPRKLSKESLKRIKRGVGDKNKGNISIYLNVLGPFCLNDATLAALIPVTIFHD